VASWYSFSLVLQKPVPRTGELNYIAHRAHDALLTEIVLETPRLSAIIGP